MSGGIITRANVPAWRVGDTLATPATSLAATAFPNGQGRLARTDFPVSGTITLVSFNMTVAGGAGALLRPLLYVDTDNDQVPDTLLADLGVTDGTVAAGVISVVCAVPVPAGPVWGTVVCQGAPAPTPTLQYVSQSNLPLTFPGAIIPNEVAMCWEINGVVGVPPVSITPTQDQNPIRMFFKRGA